MSEVIVIDSSEPVDIDRYIRPTKSEEDEIQGKRPDWPMITRDDIPV